MSLDESRCDVMIDDNCKFTDKLVSKTLEAIVLRTSHPLGFDSLLCTLRALDEVSTFEHVSGFESWSV